MSDFRYCHRFGIYKFLIKIIFLNLHLLFQQIYYHMQLQQPIKSQLTTKFKVIKLLGKGSFGNVYECQDLVDWQHYAVKVISKVNVKTSKIQSLKEEAKLLQSLEHKNIVKIYQYGQMTSCIFIKMEIAIHGTLQNLIQKKKQANQTFTDEQTSKIMGQIFSGLTYIHSLNIIHRDIKPQNLLITEGDHMHQLKICDFGLSTKLNFHYPKSAIVKCGTLLFMAPEILCKYTYTKAIDIWSVSIIMFIMFNGKHPIWKEPMTTEEYSAIMAKKIALPELKNAAKLAQDFYGRIAKIDPHQRYSAQQGLKHPWITRDFHDQIPLAVHQSYSSFNTASQVVKMIKICMVSRFLCQKQREEIPPDYYSKLSYRTPSPNKDNTSTSIKIKKLKSLNFEKQMKVYDKLQIFEQKTLPPRNKFRIASQSQNQTPAINKLNHIFNTLFDKKITSKSKLSFKDKKQNTKELSPDVPNLTQFKDNIQRQIQKSVVDVLQNNRNKNRRILPVKSKKDLLALKNVKMVDEENGIKTTFIRKNKIKKRNTTEQRNLGK